MSEEKNFNEEVFQSFSKDYLLETNKKQNKTCINESTEFSFKKNLSINDGSNHNHNYNNKSAINDPGFNIYSVNDKNIQESGHFGKSKYDSKNFKSMIEENSLIKNPLFYVENKNEEENDRNLSNFGKNESKSNFFNNQLKKIQIIRKKRISKENNNSASYNCLKKSKMGPISTIRNNKKIEEEISLLKKKYSNFDCNTMKDLSNINNINNQPYISEKEKKNKTFYKNNTLELNVSNIQNYYKNENNHFYSKIYKTKKTINKSNNCNISKSPTLMNNSYIKSFKENKENILNNFNRNSRISPHYKNIINVLKSNNSKYYSINDVNSINLEPEKYYKKIKVVNKSSNQNFLYEMKNKKNKNNYFVGEGCNDTFYRNKKVKGEIKNRLIKANNDISYDKIILNKTSAQCLGAFNAKTGKIQPIQPENKRGKYPTYQVAYDKRTCLKEQILPYYFENHGINF